jgi:hypothetical protein
LRVKPRGGTASYAEIMRNVKRLEEMLLASNNDLRTLGHGGTRRGEEFVNNKHENVIKVLALRLGKSISTIKQYLSHARYLSEEMLNILATRGINKDFFEKANANKTATLTRLKSNRKPDGEITDQISNYMLAWLQDYEQHKKIERVWEEVEVSSPDESQEERNLRPAPVEIKVEQKEEKIFNPWRGNPEEFENDSFEQLKRETDDLAKRLLDAVVLEDPNLFYERILEEAPRFHQISHRAVALKKIQRRD